MTVHSSFLSATTWLFFG